MDKVILHMINQLADKLPIVTETTYEEHWVDGFELIEQGHYELQNGEKVVMGVKYSQPFPVIIAINHRRRMKEAYKKEGGMGIANYIAYINKLIDLNAEKQ